MNSLESLVELYTGLLSQANALPEQDYGAPLVAAANAPDGRQWNVGLPLAKADIVGELDEILNLIKRAATQKLLPSQRLMLSYQLNHAFNQLRDALNNLAAPSVAWGYINQIHSVKMQLEAAGITSLTFDRDLLPSNLKMIKSAVGEADRLLNTKVELGAVAIEIADARARANTAAQESASSYQAIEQLRTDAKLSAEAVGVERSNILQFREKAESSADVSAEAARVAKENEQATLDLVDKIKDRLDLINRKSLGSSFQARRDELDLSKERWLNLFAGSLLLLVMGGVFAFSQMEPVKDAWSLVDKLLKEIPIVGPLLWLAWYCASKAGTAQRIAEDYAFKVAAAMAFEGYKKEVEGDDQLKAALLAKTVETFGENPIRLYGKASVDKAHPVEGLVEMMKDEKLSDKMFDLLKAVLPGRK